jgi:hypothetical protein
VAIILAFAALLVTGEAARVALGQQTLVLTVAGGPPREIGFSVDDTTQSGAAPRSVWREDIRPGGRAVVSGTDVEGGRGADLVRAGTSRAAVAPLPPTTARP